MKFKKENVTQHKNVLVNVCRATNGVPWQFYVKLESKLPAMHRLCKELQAYCSGTPPLRALPAIGESVFVRMSESWYRAEVQQLMHGFQAELWLVDFGMSLKANVHAMRAPCEELINLLPAQAILCNLEGADSFDLSETFIKITKPDGNAKTLELEVVGILGNAGTLLVTLYDPNVPLTEPRYSITDQLHEMSLPHNGLSITYYDVTTSSNAPYSERPDIEDHWVHDRFYDSGQAKLVPPMEAPALKETTGRPLLHTEQGFVHHDQMAYEPVRLNEQSFQPRINYEQPLESLKHSELNQQAFATLQRPTPSQINRTLSGMRSDSIRLPKLQGNFEEKYVAPSKAEGSPMGPKVRPVLQNFEDAVKRVLIKREQHSVPSELIHLTTTHLKLPPAENYFEKSMSTVHQMDYEARKPAAYGDKTFLANEVHYAHTQHYENSKNGLYAASSPVTSRPQFGSQQNASYRDEYIETIPFFKADRDLELRDRFVQSSKSNVPAMTSGTDNTNQELSTNLKFRTQSLLSGEVVQVVYYENPGHFFVQLESSAQELNALMDKVLEACSSGAARPLLGAKVGDVCLALYSEDEVWYRAQVTATRPQTTVKFVDFGNEAPVSEVLRCINVDMIKLPCQAMYCKLHGVAPAQGSVWSTDQLDKFSAAVENNRSLVVKILETTRDGQYSVELRDSETVVNKLLQGKVPQLPNMAPPCQAAQTAVPLHGARRDLETWDKFVPSPKSSVPAAKSGTVKTNQEMSTNLQFRTQSLLSGEVVQVVYYENPGHFFVQLESSAQELNALMDKVLEACSSGAARPLLGAKVGDVCLAFYSEDEVWYRAQVTATQPQTTVKFVDFGNEGPVSESLRCINVDMTKLPCQAMYCKLHGVAPAQGNVWSTDQLDKFDAAVKNYRSLVVKILETTRDGQYSVELHDGETIVNKLFQGKVSQLPSMVPPCQAAQTAVPLHGARRELETWDKFVPSPKSSVPVAKSGTVNTNQELSTNLKFRTQSLLSGEVVQVVYYENPGHFFVQLESSAQELNALMDKVLEACSSGAARPLLGAKVGDVCLALYSEDEVWYRAQVTATQPQTTVKFVDFGNQAPVNEVLRCINVDMIKLPCQAMYCKLHGVAPAQGSVWSTDQHDKFDAAVENNRSLVVKILETTRDGQYSVELRDGETVVNKLLQGKVPQLPSIAPACQAVQTMAPICESDRDFEVPAATSGTVNTNQELSTNLQFRTQSLLSGEVVQVVYYENPSHFFVQLESSAQELNALMDKVLEACSSGAARPLLGAKVGDVCLALYSEDEVWYRAQVTATQPQTTVKFVDFGNEAPVSEVLRCINIDMIKLPCQAMYCKLHGVAPAQGSVWSTDQLDKFSAAVENNRSLVVKLVETTRDGQYSVELHDSEMIVNELFQIKVTQLPNMAPPPSAAQVSISFFTSPGDFYVCFENRVGDLAKMQLEVQTSAVGLLEPSRVCVGDLVLAPRDNMLHRAKVIAVKDLKARAFYLDIGITRVVLISQLRPLPPTVAQESPFAAHCQLGAIEPKLRNNWPLNCDTVDAIFKASATFELTVLEENDGLWQVELKHDMMSLSAALVDAGIAKYSDCPEESSLQPGDLKQVVVSYIEESGLVHVQELDLQDNLDLIQDTLQSETLTEYFKPMPGKFAAVQNMRDNLWYRGLPVGEVTLAGEVPMWFVDFGPRDLVLEIRELPAGIATLPPLASPCRFATPCSTTPDELLLHVLYRDAEGILIVEDAAEPALRDAFMMYVETPSTFYVQPAELSEQFTELEKALLEAASFPELIERTVGTHCVAQFSEDGVWYRSVILSVNEEAVEVMFLDYGNTASATQLRQMPADIRSIDSLARRCALLNPPRSEQGIKRFLDLANDAEQPFQVLWLAEGLVALFRDGKDLFPAEEQSTLSFHSLSIPKGLAQKEANCGKQIESTEEPQECLQAQAKRLEPLTQKEIDLETQQTTIEEPGQTEIELKRQEASIVAEPGQTEIELESEEASIIAEPEIEIELEQQEANIVAESEVGEIELERQQASIVAESEVGEIGLERQQATVLEPEQITQADTTNDLEMPQESSNIEFLNTLKTVNISQVETFCEVEVELKQANKCETANDTVEIEKPVGVLATNTNYELEDECRSSTAFSHTLAGLCKQNITAQVQRQLDRDCMLRAVPNASPLLELPDISKLFKQQGATLCTAMEATQSSLETAVEPDRLPSVEDEVTELVSTQETASPPNEFTTNIKFFVELAKNSEIEIKGEADSGEDTEPENDAGRASDPEDDLFVAEDEAAVEVAYVCEANASAARQVKTEVEDCSTVTISECEVTRDYEDRLDVASDPGKVDDASTGCGIQSEVSTDTVDEQVELSSEARDQGTTTQDCDQLTAHLTMELAQKIPDELDNHS